MEAVISAVAGFPGLSGLLQGRHNRKRKKAYGEILNICLHRHALPLGNNRIDSRSAFEPRSDTTRWFCNVCGLNATEQRVRRIEEEWEFKLDYDHNGMLARYIKHDKKYARLAKRLNMLGGPPRRD
ncbi:MAG: hypothetical protein KTV68_08505 [Acidimicrobiia bacterium]|nr:hypothetical protein [Acidimicrobiia bacterium]